MQIPSKTACPELFERSLALQLNEIYSVSHKVEIGERFKSHWTDFKGQLKFKTLKKIEYKLNGKNVDIKMTNLMLNCLFLTFSNVKFMGQTIF